MQNLFFLFLIPLSLLSCLSKGQEKALTPPVDSHTPIGGGCDGCEIMYIGMPARIHAADTSLGWPEARTKLVVRGTVYQSDGHTPAPEVIIYYWHTDERGYYSKNAGLPGGGDRHGARRGWMKTGADGKYALYTNRPAPYPSRDSPAHIHLAIKEPGLPNEYYVDELVFEDDPLLTTAKRKALENRGGSGILRPRAGQKNQIAEHDIILGLHIPNYPAPASGENETGLPIGEESPSFTPYHAWGPDKGSKACPVCKYGRNYGILYFVKNTEPLAGVKKWLVFLENLSQQKGGSLKVYLVYESGENRQAAVKLLEQLGRELDLKQLALTLVPSFEDMASEVHLNRIGRNAASTFIVYKNRIIIDKHLNLAPTAADFQKLTRKLPAVWGIKPG